MVWYVLLAVVAVLFVLSVALPVPRRMWAFSLITAKYFWLWVFDKLMLRRLWFAITGRNAKYQKLTRPVLMRMFCEDLGPTFIKFGQIIASSAGMFPDAYVKEFQRVLDRVKPFPYADVKRTLDEELGAEKAAHLVDIEPKQLAHHVLFGSLTSAGQNRKVPVESLHRCATSEQKTGAHPCWISTPF